MQEGGKGGRNSLRTKFHFEHKGTFQEDQEGLQDPDFGMYFVIFMVLVLTRIPRSS